MRLERVTIHRAASDLSTVDLPQQTDIPVALRVRGVRANFCREQVQQRMCAEVRPTQPISAASKCSNVRVQKFGLLDHLIGTDKQRAECHCFEEGFGVAGGKPLKERKDSEPLLRSAVRPLHCEACVRLPKKCRGSARRAVPQLQREPAGGQQFLRAVRNRSAAAVPCVWTREFGEGQVLFPMRSQPCRWRIRAGRIYSPPFGFVCPRNADHRAGRASPAHHHVLRHGGLKQPLDAARP